MSDAVVVEGEVVNYKSTADGGLRITIELGELEAAKFHEGFGTHAWVAVARLEDKPSA